MVSKTSRVSGNSNSKTQNKSSAQVKTTNVWNYINERWVCSKDPVSNDEEPIATMFEFQLVGLLDFFEQPDAEQRLTDLGVSESTNNSILWNFENTKKLVYFVKQYGTNWPLINDRMLKYFTQPDLKIGLSLRTQLQCVCGASMNVILDNQLASTAPDWRNCELKDRFFFILNNVPTKEQRYNYSGIADSYHKQVIYDKYSLNLSECDKNIRAIISKLQNTTNQFNLKHNLTESKFFSDIKANQMQSQNYPKLANINSTDLVSFSDIFSSLFKNNSCVLVSSLEASCADTILQNLKTSSKHSWLISAGRDYHTSIIKVLNNAKFKAETKDSVLESPLGEKLKINQYFMDDKYTPYIHSCDTFTAYVNSIFEACIIVNLEKQLKQINQSISQWQNKLLDLKRSVRSVKRSLKSNHL